MLLKIECEGLSVHLHDNKDSISNIIQKYEIISPTIAIKNAFSSHLLVFETVNMDEILKEIKNLGSLKVTQECEIKIKR